ncbi:MAG: ester cyclase [Solirubrobacterales bacterium]
MSLPEKYDHLETIKDIHDYFLRECQEGGNIEIVADFFTDDYVQHTPDPGQAADRSGAVQAEIETHSALGDVTVEVIQQVVGADMIATYKIISGRHVGEGLGTPPSGERVSFRVMDMVRYRDRQIAEHWHVLQEG